MLTKNPLRKLSSSGRVSRLAQGLLWPFRKEEVNDLISLIERQKAAFGLAIQNDNMYSLAPVFSNLKAEYL